jgi:hypothetical protein
VRAGWLVPALVAAALLGGCGDDGDDDAAPSAKAKSAEPKSVGRRSAGSVVQFADCNDWRRGTRAEREATVRELRDQLTQQGEPSNASPLSDERAYATFQKACRPDYAGSLRLYKLYVRVQGYAPLHE